MPGSLVSSLAAQLGMAEAEIRDFDSRFGSLLMDQKKSSPSGCVEILASHTRLRKERSCQVSILTAYQEVPS